MTQADGGLPVLVWVKLHAAIQFSRAGIFGEVSKIFALDVGELLAVIAHLVHGHRRAEQVNDRLPSIGKRRGGGIGRHHSHRAGPADSESAAARVMAAGLLGGTGDACVVGRGLAQVDVGGDVGGGCDVSPVVFAWALVSKSTSMRSALTTSSLLRDANVSVERCRVLPLGKRGGCNGSGGRRDTVAAATTPVGGGLASGGAYGARHADFGVGLDGKAAIG